MRIRTLTLFTAITGLALGLSSCKPLGGLTNAVTRTVGGVGRAVTAPLRAIN